MFMKHKIFGLHVNLICVDRNFYFAENIEYFTKHYYDRSTAATITTTTKKNANKGEPMKPLNNVARNADIKIY